MSKKDWKTILWVKTVKEMVFETLRDHPETRDSDSKLKWTIYLNYLWVKTVTEGTIVPRETDIVRYRAAIQEAWIFPPIHSETIAKRNRYREEKTHEFRAINSEIQQVLPVQEEQKEQEEIQTTIFVIEELPPLPKKWFFARLFWL
jgi:hypothetical protein